MTNSEALREKIDESGYKRSYIADRLGISRESLNQKVSGRREFKASEISQLCEILGISDLHTKEHIFFAN